MSFAEVAEWFAFAILAVISVAGALGMATTMSMFRSGIFLMASFIGVAGLFVLLSADLLGLLQVMMYIGGMLVMILFMVLFSHDPGGSMMAEMDMSLIERFFSLGLSSPPDEGMEHGDGMDMGGSGGHEGMEHEGMEHGDGMDMGGSGGHEGMDMGGMDMSMTTPVKRWAAALSLVLGGGLVALLLLRPAWPTTDATPSPESARMIGELLMSKYMMAFESAGLLILIGIFGAVLVARPGAYPDRDARDAYVTADLPPAPIEEGRPPSADAPVPPEALEEVTVNEAHRDKAGGPPSLNGPAGHAASQSAEGDN